MARSNAIRTRLDALEDRANPVAALFDPATHVLTVTGTPFTDYCELSVVGGEIRVNGSAVPGGPTVANTDAIQVSTGDGIDAVTLDLSGGAFGPGFTPEAGGSSEIEIAVDTGDTPQDGITVRGSAGDDVIDLGITGPTRAINLNGDDDADLTATGGNVEYRVYAGAGSDRVNAGGGPAVGGPFQGLTLDGGAGDDTLVGGGEGMFTTFNTFEGGPGNDLMVGSSALDRYFFTGAHLGHDTVSDVADQNNDTLIFCDFGGIGVGGFAGPVNLNLGLTTPQVVNSAHLTLTLRTLNGIDHVIGSIYDDVLVGSEWVNLLDGGYDPAGNSGDDVIYGRAGNDVIYGRGGSDFLSGGTEDDTADGGAGSDAVVGDAGNDTLDGGTGADVLDGAAGNDHLDGGTGADALFGRDGNDTLSGGVGADFLAGGAGDDQLRGAAGNDVLSGDAGNDHLHGGGGDDLLLGGAGHDDLDGGTGRDRLYGQTGDDTLDGGDDDESDVLTGGPGRDGFRFRDRGEFFLSDFDFTDPDSVLP
jgi:Ca2+-binding RTX toxin-like protein